MKTIEIPDDLYQQLSRLAEPFVDKSPADVIKKLLGKNGSVSRDEPVHTPDKQAVSQAVRYWGMRGGRIQVGTRLRARYKGSVTAGHVEDERHMLVDGKPFENLSSAARYVARKHGNPNPSIDGWKFWEYEDGETQQWVSVNELR